MRLFISAGEPSGDLHAANLVRSLRALQPDLVCAGFGGTRSGQRRLRRWLWSPEPSR